MHVEQEQERQMQMQKQQQQQFQQRQQQQHVIHQDTQHVVLVEQGVQIQQQSENQMNNSILKPVSHQYISREAVHEPPKLQTVQIIKNPTNFATPQNHQQQYLSESPGTLEIVGERQMDQVVRGPLNSITPVKYISQGTTKSQVQSIKIVQQDQSVPQVQLGGNHLSADGASISRGSTIPVYVALPTGSSAPQNQPKLLPVAVIAKPPTHPHQPRQQKQVNRYCRYIIGLIT